MAHICLSLSERRARWRPSLDGVPSDFLRLLDKAEALRLYPAAVTPSFGEVILTGQVVPCVRTLLSALSSR